MYKAIARRLLGENLIGTLEFYLKPSLKESWGGPMNGQAFRRQIFEELRGLFPFRAVIETGTFRGTTTEYFATTGLPVHTAEASPRYYAFAQRRLRGAGPHVHLHQGDSRAILRRLAQNPAVPDEDVFFYLDAHWEEDLPLGEELAIIFGHWRRAVVMVDDFEVPGGAYAYDDYGEGKALTMDYLAPLQLDGLRAYFPAAPAEEETGARRGCVVLCAEPEVAARLDAARTLVPYADAAR